MCSIFSKYLFKVKTSTLPVLIHFPYYGPTFLACGPKAASHIGWNSHSVLGLNLFMFHYIILTFDFNAQRTRLILSILIYIRFKASSKNKRWKISALPHRLSRRKTKTQISLRIRAV